MSTDRKRTVEGLLDPAERKRLASILSRLASPFEGERATAALLASGFIARHKLEWDDLDALLRPAQADAPDPALAHAPDPALAAPSDRRRSSPRLTWRGYCRRRRSGSLGQQLDVMS